MFSSANTSPPDGAGWMPAAACDAHCHVFGPASRFPYAAERSFTPEDRPKESLFALHQRLGISRCVVVQSNCHGYDNAVVQDAIAARPADCRGVALLPVDVADAELRRLDRAGFRGVRFNFMRHLGRAAAVDDVVRLGARLAPLGWHLQIHCESGLLAELAPALRRSPVPVVIDHMGRVDAAMGTVHPHFQALLELLEDERFWVKVSGADRASAAGAPYADALVLARHLVANFPQRTLWGTDWPHPNIAGPTPDDAVLAGLIADMAPTADARRQLLVDNPVRLYRFDGPTAGGAS